MERQIPEWLNEAWESTVRKTVRISERIGSGFPHASVGGTYVLEEPHWWTAGFWPGLLWLVYEECADERLRKLAEQCEERLDAVLHDYTRLDHDLGFMWTLTSIASYKLTQSAESRRRALQAANYLAGRFNLKGRYIRAWNPWREGEDNAGLAIIDCCMNMPLLHWASRTSGDPRYSHIAQAHMETVLEHFIRPDGSVYHIVQFDPSTGACVGKLGGQGYAPESAWSRGTAWALYGLTLAYHHTGERKYIDAAKRVAHYFLSQLPEDSVPYWDFRIPPEVTKYRDSSAGACAASGLLLLAEKTGELEAATYHKAGVRILESLYRNYGTWDDHTEEGLIKHGTSHYPEGKNIDVPLIYGDYYFVEGLVRLRGGRTMFWE
ncbi:glycoside hydrolase family 88 protein [Paenibacillus sp. P96]|uniref:Glycoside hydrolase family 88 protein n=1 Tax=Paenibacillus zeirhizosphaerae TaxID=2987519 RepID=A0ABT9FRM9_9BACL|nr:glycoside hydrolase family 88 protein [Paenibacillus sp. P96]MDP4097382.1 glycoside hydrolase family 88 protein [Paenibacillus sp. P96]